MLVWSRSGRFIVWLLAALLIGIIFIAPLAVILAASLAQAVERRPADRLHLRTLCGRWKRRLRRRGGRKPHHRARGEPSRASLRILGGVGFARSRGGVEPDLGPIVLHSKRGAVGVGGAGPPGRVQPAAAAPQRHDGDRHPRPFRADLRFLFRQCLGRARAAKSGLRGSGLKPRRAAGLSALQRDPADDRAVPHRRLRLELRAFDGRTRGDGHGLSARMGDAAGRHLRTHGSRRHFFRARR